MNEETVKAVLVRYLLRMNLRPYVQKGAGPDVLCDGAAIEVKGVNLRVPGLIKQLARYAFTHSDVAVAFPVDALSLDLLYGLAIVEGALKWHDPSRPRNVATYLVAESQDGRKLRKYESIAELRKEADDVLGINGIILPSGQPVTEIVSEVGRRATDIHRVLVAGVRERINQLGMDA